jgi:Tol biopolymer transport system component
MRISASIAVGLFLGLLVVLEAQAQLVDSIPTIHATLTRVYAEEGTDIYFPSPSPDGRWIVFQKPEGDGQISLWLVPGGGGEAVRLTQGHWDAQPVWFPSGDRIAFRSDRPSRDEKWRSYVMTLSLDPESGRPTAPPRQVSVEECFSYLDVSPNGEWITFGAFFDGKAILVVPAAGGASRVVARDLTWRPTWGPDGESIYYSVSRPLEGSGEALLRASMDGRVIDTVFTGPKSIVTLGSPAPGWALREISGGDAESSLWEVVTLDGAPVGRLELPPHMDALAATSGGGALVAARHDLEASLEIQPIDGGPPLRLNETRGLDRVLGWAPDGERVFFETTLDGREAYFLAGTHTAMREVPFPERPTDEVGPILSADGRHVLYATRNEERSAASLRLLDLELGRSTELTGSPVLPSPSGLGELTGRGGTFQRDARSFLYVERRDGVFELRAVQAGESSRLLRTFRGELPERIAVHGDRIAYSQRVEGPAGINSGARTVMLARAGQGEAQSLGIRPDSYVESLTWSWDGTRLAVGKEGSDLESESPGGMELCVLDIGPSGAVLGEPTVLDTPESSFWSPRWLPGDRALVIPAGDAMVWRVSLDPRTRPVNLTRQVGSMGSWVYAAEFRLSPDGRFIAYAPATLRGASIWWVDLGDALAAAKH